MTETGITHACRFLQHDNDVTAAYIPGGPLSEIYRTNAHRLQHVSIIHSPLLYNNTVSIHFVLKEFLELRHKLNQQGKNPYM